MAEIVKTVSCLCKLLNNTICPSPSLKPEFFRLSKLNKLCMDEIQQFWNILHRLCCFSISSPCQNDAVKCVTHSLLTQGRVVAYSLPPDATPRQLLLCFGWLLSHGVVESIIDKIILETPLADEFPQMLDESDEPVTVGRPPLQNDPEDLINYATYLSGCIQHNLRAIANYRHERAHLLAKVHKATAGTHRLGHLSAGDVGLLSRPRSVPDFVSKCRHCLPTLKAYSKWHEESPVFWQWMSSILLEEESLSVNKDLSEKEKCQLIEFSKVLENNIRREARMGNEDFYQEKFEFLTTRRMRLCENGKFLEDTTNLLDCKINILNKINERKQQELESKLSACEQADGVNKIFSKFGIKLPTTIQHSSPTTQAMSNLFLD